MDYNNPVMLVDPTGDYSKYYALQYAYRWYGGRNPAYPSFGNDCTNFISQCLVAGGIGMTSNWYVGWKYLPRTTIRRWVYSKSWSVANEQYKYFKKSKYVSKEYSFSSLSEMKAILSKVSAGDLIYFDFDNNGKMNHASMITGVANNMIYYTGHTKDRYNWPLTKPFSNYPKLKVYILVLK